jgi:hypothetical protein
MWQLRARLVQWRENMRTHDTTSAWSVELDEETL